MKRIGLRHARFIASSTILWAGPILCSSAIGAQSPGALTGSVNDSAGDPVSGAIIEVVGSPVKARSDDKGEFRLTNLTAGVVTVQVRRLGFTAMSQDVRLSSGEVLPLRIVLSPSAATVDPVVVQASRADFTGRLAGYYERLHRHSSGTFISREQLDRNSNKNLSQLLGSTPGVSATQLRTGGGGVRIRGMRCRPLVWLDGVPLPAGEVDLNAFPVSTLHGIEIYLGATNSPPGFTALDGASSCGTILLWSRGRDTEYAEVARRASMDIEEITAGHGVFTADQVDTPARLTRTSLEVLYPPDLAASKTAGSAIAEFIVSSTGEIEKASIGVVTASHPLFADAAIHALASAQYAPALKGGIAVRQLVQQPFNFSLGSGGASTSVRR